MAEENNPLSNFNKETLNLSRELQESLGELTSLTSQMSRNFREVDGGLGGTVYKIAKIRRSAEDLPKIQNQLLKSSKGTARAIEEEVKNRNLAGDVIFRINRLLNIAEGYTGETRENILKQARYLGSVRDDALTLAKAYKDLAVYSGQLDSSTAFFTGISKVVKDIPILRRFANPFERAAEAARLQFAENIKNKEELKLLGKLELDTRKRITRKKLEELNLTRITGESTGKVALAQLRAYRDSLKTIGGMRAGFNQLGLAIRGSLAPLSIFLGVVTIAKEFVQVLIGGYNQTVKLAKGLGITKEEAGKLKQEYRQILKTSDNLLVNIDSLTEAQTGLSKTVGATLNFSKDMLEDQVLLTKNIGLSEQAAATFLLTTKGIGNSLERPVDQVIKLNEELNRTEGFAVDVRDIFKSIAGVNAEILGYYGNNVKELVAATRQATRYGLSLQQAQTVSKGLLNFESSIRAELEAELLSNRELNLERARYLALTGDIAGAAADVVKQAQKLSSAQRRNPIILESMAKAAGLTAEQLNEAFIKQKNITSDIQEYINILKKDGKEQEAALATRLGMQGLTRKKIEEQLTFQEALTAATTKMQGALQSLIEQGYIDKLIDMISGGTKFFVKAIEFISYLKYLRPLFDPTESLVVKGYRGLFSDKKESEIPMDDGIIGKDGSLKVVARKGTYRLNKEDQVVVGTDLLNPTSKVSSDNNALLVNKIDELIKVSREGKEIKLDVYIDGNRTGQKIALTNSSQLS